MNSQMAKMECEFLLSTSYCKDAMVTDIGLISRT